MGKKLSLEDGQIALRDHIIEKGLEIREKYGPEIDDIVLLDILSDDEFIRFPTRVEFNTSRVDEGLFAVADPIEDSPQRGYIIYVHEFFKDKTEFLPALVLYHLVTVNYGDFASHEDAEIFGATVLGMDKEDYYQLLCNLTDMIPGGK